MQSPFPNRAPRTANREQRTAAGERSERMICDMRHSSLLAVFIVAFALVSETIGPADTMADAARRFLATLSPELRKSAQMALDDEDRTTWNYVPIERKGVSLKMLDETQRRAAMSLLRTGLSETGYKKAEAIRALEDILLEMEGPRAANMRDREKYHFTVFGDPKAGGTWGWRYEGHHLSQHWTIVNGKAIASTPQFFGVNPAHIREGKLAGSRPLAAEEDLAFALLNSLDADQQSRAIIDPKAPRDILTTNTREATMQEDRGLTFREMSPLQRKHFMTLLEEHVGAQAQPLAQERLARLRAAGLDNIRFAWMGAKERSEAGHYYRIQGPTFLIEFDNTQNRANHIHQVWRDFKGDFGRDLLAEHYRKSH